jgi:hypothetical protein
MKPCPHGAPLWRGGPLVRPRATGLLCAGHVSERTVMEIKTIGIVGAGQMGNGIAHVCALAGYDVIMTDISQEALDSAIALIDRTSAGRSGAARSPRMRRPRRWAHQHHADADRCGPHRPGDRGRDGTGNGEGGDLRGPAAASEARDDPDLQHLVDLDHAPCQPHRPAGTVHGVPFHEPGAGDAAGGTDPRHRHRRADLQGLQGGGGPVGQDGRHGRGFPGLHRQPHPDADDQRGGLHALRRAWDRSNPSTSR